ncbi:efflux RND transporter periplasmic adaptor subunit [Veillonella criceti]|uniref:Multidrug resistance protein MdtE n=1 Tax=Veillonella criceti TaxID=103891 RepID=A0A380NN61_9FIRM|nr:efflux RND transporter periplasmic adaptor subunit [Veillonella criceti]SUP43910.1 Multidrug resistance protein MdtE precursor [Veillonella criceti]
MWSSLRSKHMIFCVLMISCLAFISGCGSDSKTKEQAPLVKTMVVGKESASNENSLSGTIKNRYETALSFQIGGRVIQKNFNVGDRVSAGQILAVLNQGDTSSQLQNAQGALAAAQSQYELAATNVERYRVLYAQEAVSQLQLDQMENSYKVAAAQLAQAQANVQTSENQQNYTQLVAPADGIITASTIEVGQVVGAGQTVGMIAVGDEPEAVISLPEQMMASVQVGTEANVTYWALPNVITKGIIREISPVPDATARTYTVKVALSNRPTQLQLGMTANVAFNQSNGQAIEVPLTALVGTRDPKQNGKGQVYVVTKEHTVKLISVTLGPMGANSVQVTSGLQSGDRIVTAGTDKLEEGAKVRV